FQSRSHLPFKSSRPLLVEDLPALCTQAHAFPLCLLAVLDPRWPAVAAHKRHVRDVNGPLFFEDAASDLARGIGTRVPLDHVDVLDKKPPLLGLDLQHPSHFPLVPARNDLHRIVLSNIQTKSHQRTSGASETILRNFFSRNSLATGPNTRVPTGSPASLIRTAAFSSKRI